jgi:Tfp pilus assembly protein PilO
MKFTYRRQKKQYFFAAALAAIGVMNVLFFLFLYRPARNDYYGLQDSMERLRLDIQTRQHTVGRLEKLSAQLETSEQDRHTMYTSHFLRRDIGYSQILPELENIAQRIGVRKSRVVYSDTFEPQYGLYSVKIGIPVDGTYSSIVKFIQELENSDTFFIIEGIGLRATDTTSNGNGTISLTMALETFFYQ